MTAPYYDADGITIYHGDCREILPDLPAVDLVVTDPPYAFGRRRREWQVTASIAVVLDLAARKVRPDGAMAVMTAASGRSVEFVQGAVGATLPLSRVLVMHKRWINSPAAGPWRWDIVPVLVFGRGSFGRPQLSSCYITDGQYSGDNDHPSPPLPEGVGTWLVSPFADAATVLDPYCGSGTFLVAAKAAGKRAVGIEIDERWCELAARWLDQGRLDLATAGLLAGASLEEAPP